MQGKEINWSPRIGEWTSKLQHLHLMNYYAAINSEAYRKTLVIWKYLM